MSRAVPPWIYTTKHDGHPVVSIGNRDYNVDPTKAPGFFLLTYVATKLPAGWVESEQERPARERHPLSTWVVAYQDFLTDFERLANKAEYRRILTPDAILMLLLANDLYTLDRHQKLLATLFERLLNDYSFQGVIHEISVAATMIRAGFDIVFDDESDGSRKHPEFIATHRATRVRVAVEAKSIHRTGVLGFESGKPPPTIASTSAHKIVAQVCGQVQRALPKAGARPLYVFVDLNLPPHVAEHYAPALHQEFTDILPRVDHGYTEHGILAGKKMNLLAVTNRPMHLGESGHAGGDTLNIFVNPKPDQCRYPEASHPIEDVKAAVKRYGTIAFKSSARP